MQIWVDADACPRVIKDILYRAAEKRRILLILVANQPLRTPPSPFIRTIQVAAGFDVADDRIAADLHPGDLVITADVPLAAAVIERQGHALDPRGHLYTADSIGERLMMRNVLDELRGVGVETGGPPPISQSDRQRFANSLDAFLARQRNSSQG
ncbi:MAG: YaiI/YqxD family protein [Desulfuromonas sp.]|nr:MAG: YaiI/YqxD family protein [Desulfuromonas sp.]